MEAPAGVLLVCWSRLAHRGGGFRAQRCGKMPQPLIHRQVGREQAKRSSGIPGVFGCSFAVTALRLFAAYKIAAASGYDQTAKGYRYAAADNIERHSVVQLQKNVRF